MAFVLLYNKSPITMPHDKAVMLDKVMRGVIPGTPEQQAFARGVKKVYLGKQEDTPPQPILQERLPYRDD